MASKSSRAEDSTGQVHEFLLIEPQHHPAASNHNRAADQIGFGGHPFQGFSPRRRLLTHLFAAIQLVPRVQEFPVITVADQLIELVDGQPILAEIPKLEIGAFGLEQTACLAATGSRRLVKEFYPGLARGLSRSLSHQPFTPD